MASSAANFRVEVDTEKLNYLARHLPERLAAFMDQEAEAVVNDIKLSFGTSPSSPGDPPGVDTGTLRAAQTWGSDNQGDTLRRVIYARNVDYDIHLEFGTVKMAARPYMGPAIERERRVLPGRLKDAGLTK